jgi:hypothetical protein
MILVILTVPWQWGWRGLDRGPAAGIWPPQLSHDLLIMVHLSYDTCPPLCLLLLPHCSLLRTAAVQLKLLQRSMTYNFIMK